MSNRRIIALTVIVGSILQVTVWWNALALLPGGGSEPEAAQTPLAVPEPSSELPSQDPMPTVTPKPATVRVVKVVDGDTVEVADGRTVRIIGVDAPETGECEGPKATKAMRGLVLDERVVLVKGAKTDQDKYGRLLRYVDVDGKDAGLELLKRGLAEPRYDSTDGYGVHPRERRYYEQAGEPYKCPKPKPDPTTQAPEPKPEPDVYYDNCTAARDAGAAPVRRGDPGYGDHLDRDGDGVGCE